MTKERKDPPVEFLREQIKLDRRRLAVELDPVKRRSLQASIRSMSRQIARIGEGG